MEATSEKQWLTLSQTNHLTSSTKMRSFSRPFPIVLLAQSAGRGPLFFHFRQQGKNRAGASRPPEPGLLSSDV